MDINNILDNEIENILHKELRKELYKEPKHLKQILVLSGGSTKGVAQLGALHYLKKNNLLNNINTISATSVGSCVGLMLIIGYSPIEFFKFIKLLDLSQLKKIDTHNVIAKYGLNDGSRLMFVLKKLMKAKGYNDDISFKELYKKTKINLIITGVCINDKKAYYFSHTKYPDMKVLDAIRISVSVPIYYTPFVFEEKIFIDGGCIDNFPIHLFENELEKVIGIYVTEDTNVVKNIKFIDDYLMNTIECLFEGMAHRDIRAYQKYTIQIKCKKSSDEPNDIISMFDEGYLAAQDKVRSGIF
jgi:predicted acylesterase/phospholipase RssA